MPRLKPGPMDRGTIAKLRLRSGMNDALILLEARGEKLPLQALARAAGISERTLLRRLRNPGDLNVSELLGIAAKLSIPIEALIVGNVIGACKEAS